MKFNELEIVNKPWGKEEWLELNDRYCLKKISINKGHITSLQYHEYKRETIYIISGMAAFHYKINDAMDKKILNPGDYVSIRQNEIHRMEALEDLVFVEASTPEVWDVVRLSDTYNR